MRARMGLLMARQEVLLRNIVTKDKPKEMLKISPKGTVPILIIEDGTLVDESLDIMIWALKKNDPSDLLYKDQADALPDMLNLISDCDIGFRANLSSYKNQKRYHLEDEVKLRTSCEEFIQCLESSLEKQDFVLGDKLSLADLAILPFIRQFANVDRKWFRETNYPRLTAWLAKLMQSLLFGKAMRKYSLWNDSQEEFLLSWENK
jgi:glutathione S-transferase